MERTIRTIELIKFDACEAEMFTDVINYYNGVLDENPSSDVIVTIHKQVHSIIDYRCEDAQKIYTIDYNK